MQKIQILDCTLRDGGYANNWEFSSKVISGIINGLCEANIDIVECGFLNDKGSSVEKSIFSDIPTIENYLCTDCVGTMFVAMIILGSYNIERIPNVGQGLNGIRLSFDKHEIKEAMKTAKVLKDKGYKVFVQPVRLSSNYTVNEIIDLVDRVNEVDPYAFYMVDTFGILDINKVEQLTVLIDNKLRHSVCFGYHSHNNIQLAYANSKIFMDRIIYHQGIVDSSILGMGKFAGNLCTELLAHTLNSFSEKYKLDPLLNLATMYIQQLKGPTAWGYSIYYFISALCNCNPRYVEYLLHSGITDGVKIYHFLNSIPVHQRQLFEKNSIESVIMREL